MQIIKIKDVTNRTSLCRSKIYQMMEKGTFPKPVRLGKRSVGWIDSEIDNWIKSRMMERDQGQEAEQAATVS